MSLNLIRSIHCSSFVTECQPTSSVLNVPYPCQSKQNLVFFGQAGGLIWCAIIVINLQLIDLILWSYTCTHKCHSVPFTVSMIYFCRSWVRTKVVVVTLLLGRCTYFPRMSSLQYCKTQILLCHNSYKIYLKLSKPTIFRIFIKHIGFYNRI